MSDVTIGFVPRDRFCKAAEALELLLARTARPFRLILVDPDMPEVFRASQQRLLEQHDDVTVLRTDRSTTSNGARNLVLGENRSEFLCLIENDVLVEDGWLTALIEACETHPADVAAPLLLEPRGDADKVHFDDRLGHIRRDDSGRLRILPRENPLETDRGAGRRFTDFVEMHCVLFRSSVFDRIGPFDADQHGSRAEVDISLALHEAAVSTVLEPRSRVTFSSPPPVHVEEREHYLAYWDLEAAEADHRSIQARWNLVECPSALGFVRGRRRLLDAGGPTQQLQSHLEEIATVDRAAGELSSVVPEDAPIILVDDARFVAAELCGARPTTPFLEHDGQYWGSPPDDATAIREFERLRDDGAEFIVFGWPAFWWLDHYKGFQRHLSDRFDRVLANERLAVFDLR